MTWTAFDAPREDGADDGLGGPEGGASCGPGAAHAWEPLAPGALGAEPQVAGPDALLVDPLDELPPLLLTGPLAEALATARVALDEAVTAACYLTSTGPHQRLDALRQLAVARHVADAVLARVAVSFAPEEVRALGATSATDLLITHTGAEARNAAATLRLAAALTAPPVLPAETVDDAGSDVDTGAADSGAAGASADPGAGSSQVRLGLLGAAHATGAVSTDIAALALRTLADLPARTRRACMPDADAYLAGVLPGMSHAQAETVCSALAHRLDPSRADRGFDPDDLERRYTHITVHGDGWVDVRGRFDPVTGAWIKAAVDAASKPAPTVTAPLAETQGAQDASDGADLGESAPGSGVRVRDERTAPQRRADAIAGLVRGGVEGSTGSPDGSSVGGLGARVIVTTTAENLAGLPGAAPAHCETTGRSLSSAALRTIACSASIQAVRLSCEGAEARVLSLGRAVRLFTASQRRAMLARDGGCVIPGCTSPPGWWEAHHVHEWAAGGPTDVDSGVLVCTRHHILVTLGVWQVRMVAGVPQVRPPKAVDPLRRWVLNPRRGLQAGATRAAARMRGARHLLPLLDLGEPSEPPDPPDPLEPPEALDIPSPRGTCPC